MFTPNRWIKPRLKSLSVAFGVADVTLVLLSIIGWYCFFDMSFQAQQDQLLLEYRSKGNKFNTPAPVTTKFYEFKENRNEEELRLLRTVRACGLAHYGIENELDQNFASPGALIGASMGGYAILGALLAMLGRLKSSTGRQIVCGICLVGEVSCTLFLFISVTILLGSEGLCPTEYYFENFQPIFHTFVYTLIFISSYKTYEITVIIFYLKEQTKLARNEVETTNTLRRSVDLPPIERSVMDLREYADVDDGEGDRGRGRRHQHHRRKK